MIKNGFVIVLAALLIACRTTPAAVCDESAAERSSDEQNLEQAFEYLKGCEFDPDASADALVNLLLLFSMLEVFESEEESARRSYPILVRAARMGSQFALSELVLAHRHGVKEIGLPSNAKIATCLTDVSERAQEVVATEVDECLAL